MNQEEKKKVDESYKEKVDKDKEKQEQAQESPAVPEASFSFFITTLAMQATVALGDTVNPQNNKKEENPAQAKFLIDILGTLREKTKNNLTKEENDLLEGMLYELRMRYVQKTGGTK